MPSELVQPPRVAESHCNMACRLLQVVDVSNKPLVGSIVLGEVLRFHVGDELVEDFRIDPDKTHAVGRMAGATHARTTDRFELVRPK